jgi:hypothetical protein
MRSVSLGIGRSDAADGGTGAPPSHATLPLCGPELDGLDLRYSSICWMSETYIGYERAENIVSPGSTVQNTRHVCMAGLPRLNEWALAGYWTIGSGHAVILEKGGSIIYRSHAVTCIWFARPHQVAGSVRFRVTLDGAVLGNSHGVDVDADGRGIVIGAAPLPACPTKRYDHRPHIQDRVPRSWVQAYAFTFG